MWKLIDNLTNSRVKTYSHSVKLLDPKNSQYTRNAEKMANKFNDYFVTVGKRIANSITPSCSIWYPVVNYKGPDHSFVFHETFPENVDCQ